MKKILLFALVFTWGCATTIPQENRTRIYNKSEEEAQKAAVLFLESNGYSIDADNLNLGLIKGEKSFNSLAAIFAGDGRFEISFLISPKESDQTSVTIQTKTFTKNAFGVERQSTSTGKEIQDLVDDAFAQYTSIIGGGDMGSIASIKSNEANAAKSLPCNDPRAKESRVVVYGNTPMYQQPNSGSAIVMNLAAGIDVQIYKTQGSYTQVCNEHGKAWIKSDKLGKKR